MEFGIASELYFEHILSEIEFQIASEKKCREWMLSGNSFTSVLNESPEHSFKQEFEIASNKNKQTGIYVFASPAARRNP